MIKTKDAYMTLKNHYKSSFNSIVTDVQNKFGVKVILNKNAEESFWLPSANAIVISGKSSWKRRVNFLLHEIGHVINDNAKGPVAKSIVMEHYSSSSRSKMHFVSVVNEELRAWNTGKEFAIKNKHGFDIVSYNKDTTNCLMSYVKYGLQNVYGENIDIDFINIE